MTRCGRICLGSRKINFSVVFAGQLVGVREVADQVWQVSFLSYDLRYFGKGTGSSCVWWWRKKQTRGRVRASA